MDDSHPCTNGGESWFYDNTWNWNDDQNGEGKLPDSWFPGWLCPILQWGAVIITGTTINAYLKVHVTGLRHDGFDKLCSMHNFN
ncbi:predicted protein [Sclerotinia sclerotiorum 1980 UF-70]|uniref:Uncharacterized protein n=2 Tax=Sclerotinia sclerotiorum (strain ATCC 18683 / 1980 / Ss-1) TaxID=665079 RepID=A7EB27_SCLS1|nr:predicted protein [Sclerotinia sclerotiorum 1980 UF-70]APA08741.1 hypothetical protein sscle_04g035110 [Sclerotinia sclerotiorum 1980 UF-70]EDN99655.1 predicted protein [Sclerotinia sclerotiorum 1980 UF-70]